MFKRNRIRVFFSILLTAAFSILLVGCLGIDLVITASKTAAKTDEVITFTPKISAFNGKDLKKILREFDDDGDDISLSWDFGDQTKISHANIVPVAHSYSSAGTYVVKAVLRTKKTVLASDDVQIVITPKVNVVFVDEFNTASFDNSKWVLSPISDGSGVGNMVQISQSAGSARIINGGGSNGSFGVYDGSWLTPVMPYLTGDFAVEMKVTEIARLAATGQPDMSGIGLQMVPNVNTPRVLMNGLSLGGNNYPDLAGNYSHHAVSYATFIPTSFSVLEHVELSDLVRFNLYSVIFRIERKNGVCTTTYSLAGSTNVIAPSWGTTNCGNTPVRPVINVFSGDGRTTTINGSLTLDIDYFRVTGN